MDQMLPELDQLASDTHDVETTEAIRLVLDRHGPGPYPALTRTRTWPLSPA